MAQSCCQKRSCRKLGELKCLEKRVGRDGVQNRIDERVSIPSLGCLLRRPVNTQTSLQVSANMSIRTCMIWVAKCFCTRSQTDRSDTLSRRSTGQSDWLSARGGMRDVLWCSSNGANFIFSRFTSFSQCIIAPVCYRSVRSVDNCNLARAIRTSQSISVLSFWLRGYSFLLAFDHT